MEKQASRRSGVHEPATQQRGVVRHDKEATFFCQSIGLRIPRCAQRLVPGRELRERASCPTRGIVEFLRRPAAPEPNFWCISGSADRRAHTGIHVW